MQLLDTRRTKMLSTGALQFRICAIFGLLIGGATPHIDALGCLFNPQDRGTTQL